LGKEGKIYAIGGFGGKNNEPLKSMEVFDVREGKWSKGPAMGIARRALAAAALADGIYAIGGFDGTRHLNSVEKYEEGNGEWVKLAELKRGRCTHSAVSIFETQEIIVMGGFDEEALDSVEKYSLITNNWEEISKMPSARFMHASVLFSE
jgi:N-acetylneuraminic acid mutarotase